MKKRNIAIIICIMCFALTVAIIVQYNTIKSANQIAGDAKSSELKTEVLKWKEEYEKKYSELEKIENELNNKRESAASTDSSSSELQEELKKLNALIGCTEVTGKGIIINIADNKNATNENVSIYDNISNYLIHDKDLLTLINELKNAGAEAISINDERIINSTAITCDGNVILVNNNRVSSPFQIKVIGSQETILGAIQRPGGFLEELKTYGLVGSVVKENNVVIYKYNGIIE